MKNEKKLFESNELEFDKEDIINYSNYKIIDIDLIQEADWNYKKENEELEIKLERNIQKNGLIENLHVRSLGYNSYECINGNHRLRALNKLNKKHAVVYDHGNITLEDAQIIALETNETKFISDDLKLASIIKNISDTNDINLLAETLPFNESDLKHYLELLDFELSEYKQSDEENGETIIPHLISFELNDEEFEIWNNAVKESQLSAKEFIMSKIVVV